MPSVKKSRVRSPNAGAKKAKTGDSWEYEVGQEPSQQSPQSVGTSRAASGDPLTRKGVDDVSPEPAEDDERRFRTMAPTEKGSNKLFEGFSEMTDTLFSPERAKDIAALWIDSSEKMANQALEFQAKATEWSKNTMFAPLFETQNSLARSFVELSTNAARRFWRLE